jgi:DNA-binding CsgD family transcriptional regulator
MDDELRAAFCQVKQNRKTKAEFNVSLTEREKQILSLITDGKTDKEIGEELFLSEHTVRTHLRWIKAKLHVRNRAQVVAISVAKEHISS